MATEQRVRTRRLYRLQLRLLNTQRQVQYVGTPPTRYQHQPSSYKGASLQIKTQQHQEFLLQGEAQGLALNEKKFCNQKLCWATPTEANMPTPPCHEVQCRGWYVEEPSL